MRRTATRRRVCVVTGTRAEYGILCTILDALDRHPRIQAQLVVTGMHLLPKFGRTIHQIRADGRCIDAIVRMQAGDDSREEAEALGRGIAGIGRALIRLRSDIVVVIGDRIEALAGAAAGVCSRRIVAHIHGGDRALGDVDDSIRHAVTKLAHVHLVATNDAAQRVRRLGEPPERIHVVGAPGLDAIRAVPRASTEWLRRTLGWKKFCDYAVILQHAVGRSAAIERRDMAATLNAVVDAGLAGVVVYPNSDPGHSGILAAVADHMRRRARLKEESPPWRLLVSAERTDFIRILKGARVLVGNSSCGMIESATAGVPAVNIGDRQKGRLPCGPSVIQTRSGREPVLQAIRRALRCRVNADNSVYGDGRAGGRIGGILARIPLDDAFRRKLITY